MYIHAYIYREREIEREREREREVCSSVAELAHLVDRRESVYEANSIFFILNEHMM